MLFHQIMQDSSICTEVVEYEQAHIHCCYSIVDNWLVYRFSRLFVISPEAIRFVKILFEFSTAAFKLVLDFLNVFCTLCRIIFHVLQNGIICNLCAHSPAIVESIWDACFCLCQQEIIIHFLCTTNIFF